MMVKRAMANVFKQQQKCYMFTSREKNVVFSCKRNVSAMFVVRERHCICTYLFLCFAYFFSGACLKQNRHSSQSVAQTMNFKLFGRLKINPVVMPMTQYLQCEED